MASPRCVLCEASALVFCKNDNALLCSACDAEIHRSNPVAHERTALNVSTSTASGTAPSPEEQHQPQDLAATTGEADLLLPRVKEEELDWEVPGLGPARADSPSNDSGSEQTVALAAPPLAAAKAEKQQQDLDAFLAWDGELMDFGLQQDNDFGLELDAFDSEAGLAGPLGSVGVVPIVEASEGSSCSGAPASLQHHAYQQQVQQHIVPGGVKDEAGVQAVMGVQVMGVMPGYQMACGQSGYVVPIAWPAYGYHVAFTHDKQATREARHASIKRYREKRQRRIFEKKIRYQSRKAYAEIRPRIKGRFAKRGEAVPAAPAAAAGDDCVVPVCQEACD